MYANHFERMSGEAKRGSGVKWSFLLFIHGHIIHQNLTVIFLFFTYIHSLLSTVESRSALYCKTVLRYYGELLLQKISLFSCFQAVMLSLWWVINSISDRVAERVAQIKRLRRGLSNSSQHNRLCKWKRHFFLLCCSDRIRVTLISSFM